MHFLCNTGIHRYVHSQYHSGSAMKMIEQFSLPELGCAKNVPRMSGTNDTAQEN